MRQFGRESRRLRDRYAKVAVVVAAMLIWAVFGIDRLVLAFFTVGFVAIPVAGVLLITAAVVRIVRASGWGLRVRAGLCL